MTMESLGYWMIFQVVLGIWLIISPFALGFREVTGMAINDVIVGGVVAILGLAVALASLPRVGHFEKGT
jgi:hypothetical protein